MNFNSIAFLFFFPIVCLVYYLLPKLEYRKWFLLLASFYFYINWKPEFGLLLLSCIIVSYVGSLLIAHHGGNCKLYLVVTILLNIFCLIFFKYSSFLIANINSLFEVTGFRIQITGWKILLPVGISFFIFKDISYIVDVYKGKIEAEKNFVVFALYVSFFPQILAGPIDRATNLIPQLKRYQLFDGRNVSQGLKLILWGYFLKVVFANRAIIYVDAVYGNIEHHNGTTILLAAILYSFQIYCDFAGYSLISIGCAKALGYNVPDNFSRPYFAASITDFWRRWHISLTRWLTDYIYIPLGGNRCSKLKNYYNILITFFVSGIWHGAAWNFVIWGCIHGIFQVVEKAMGFAKINNVQMGIRVIRIIITFLLVTFAWIFFRLDSFHEALYCITKIFTSAGKPFMSGDATSALEYCLLGLFIVLFKDFLDEFMPNKFILMNNKNIVVRYVSYICLSLFILAAGVFDDSQFIYFQF